MDNMIINNQESWKTLEYVCEPHEDQHAWISAMEEWYGGDKDTHIVIVVVVALAIVVIVVVVVVVVGVE